MIACYVAGPYSVPDPESNTHRAVEVAEQLSALGIVPYVPHLTHYWHARHPHDYEFWMRIALEFMSRCDAVLRLPGESPGADREVARANELGIPVFHYADELAAWASKRGTA